jgi:hypothetical protein
MSSTDSATARRIFLGAVALLVVNDWLLKGAGVLPGWLTGKLSDLAGLVVAPVVLGALLTLARVPAAASRVLAATTVGLAFAAMKLDTAFASSLDDVVNATTRAVGLPLAARTVPDPTDLLGLPLLVLGGWLAPRLALEPALPRLGALFGGLLACTATQYSQVRLDPHWGLADPRLDRMWAARIDHGAVVVQFGRQSNDGAFEVAVELDAREGPLSLDAGDVSLEAPGERVAAEVPPESPSVVRAAVGESATAIVVFRPHRATWPKGTPGALELAVSDGDRRRVLRVSLTFDERIVPWHEQSRWR